MIPLIVILQRYALNSNPISYLTTGGLSSLHPALHCWPHSLHFLFSIAKVLLQIVSNIIFSLILQAFSHLEKSNDLHVLRVGRPQCGRGIETL